MYSKTGTLSLAAGCQNLLLLQFALSEKRQMYNNYAKHIWDLTLHIYGPMTQKVWYAEENFDMVNNLILI